MRAPRPIFALVASLFATCAAAGVEVRLSAAVSLADAVQELAATFTAATGHKVELNFGGSGLLARQIRDGAPVDVFFPADERWINKLAGDGLIDPASRRVVLHNQLVLIVAEDEPRPPDSFAALAAPEVRRIAVGEPETVPAGAYARAWLESQDLWAAVQPKVVPLPHVRAVLAAVAGGHVNAGIVYRTDARTEPRVRVVAAVPPGQGPPIRYVIAVLRTTQEAEAAHALVAHLTSNAARSVYRKYGFIVPEKS